MKAAVLRDLSRPMTIEDVEIARPRGREVLIRVAAVGLCHSDLHFLEGSLPTALPAILGHEAAGVVEQVGPEVRSIKPGDHVVASLVFSCGHCHHCHGGHVNRCMTPEAARGVDEPARLTIGGEAVAQVYMTGAFAEQMLVHESGCVAIRKDMPLDRACLIGCGVTTGFGAAARTANVQAGETVVVIGCGGVGLSAVNGAYAAGAGRIIAVDRIPGKLELAKTFGATDTIDASAGDVVEQVMAMTGGQGVHHAIEAIGLPQTIQDAFRMLMRGGVATIAGVPAMGATLTLPAMLLTSERKLQGSLMGSMRPAIDIPNYVELYLQGRLKLDELISRRRPLEEINEGFEDLRKGELARSVIQFAV